MKEVCMTMYLEVEKKQTRQHTKQKRTWRHNSQAYAVKGWTTEIEDQDNHNIDGKTLGCATRGMKVKKQRPPVDYDDEEIDDENDQFVCSMTGQKWESLPFPNVIDSGACASVMPSDWCSHVKLLKTPQVEAGEYFRAANGKKIFNEGQKPVSMMTKEGAMRDMSFAVCAVTKALGSVSQMCKAGNKVVFNPPWHPEGSYIEHEEAGGRLWLEEQGGLYVLHAKVAPQSRQTSSMYNMNPGFQWPVNP